MFILSTLPLSRKNPCLQFFKRCLSHWKRFYIFWFSSLFCFLFLFPYELTIFQAVGVVGENFIPPQHLAEFAVVLKKLIEDYFERRQDRIGSPFCILFPSSSFQILLTILLLLLPQSSRRIPNTIKTIEMPSKRKTRKKKSFWQRFLFSFIFLHSIETHSNYSSSSSSRSPNS